MTRPAPRDPQALRATADAVLELHEEGRLEQALAACQDVLDAADDLEHPVVRESAFVARFERAVLLAELGELHASAGEALAAAEQLPFDDADPDQRHEVAMLLAHAGTCRAALHDHAGALEVLDRLLARFGHADDPVTREQIVRARVDRAVALLSLARHDDVLATVRGLVTDLDPADPAEAEQLAMVHRVRAASLRALGRREDAVAALADAEALAVVGLGGVRSQAAAAQVERAELLAELGRTDEAIALLDPAVD